MAKKSKKKAQVQHRQKVKKRRKIVADQETDVVGNNAEPQAPEVNEDAGKDIVILDEHANYPDEPFDPKNAMADFLKKHGV